MSSRTVDFDEAQGFLDMLAPSGAFSFQTFDDSPEKRKHMAHVLHGDLPAHGLRLQRYNADGAGVFVTVNETDLKGRKRENVTRVRALYVDLDGSPIEPVREGPLSPHVVVESSPGRWHAYWLVSDCDLLDFTSLQRGLIARFCADESVHDLPRVMRLPGFWHCKGEPYRTRIADLCERPAYSVADVLSAFGWQSSADAVPKKRPPLVPVVREQLPTQGDDLVDDLRDALRAIPSRDWDVWVAVAFALKTMPQQSVGRSLWMEWSQASDNFDQASADRTWDELQPSGEISYQAVFVRAKQHSWDPASSPSVKRKKALAAKRNFARAVPHAFEPPPADGTSAAPPADRVTVTGVDENPPPMPEEAPSSEPVVMEQTPEALLARYELIYGTKQVWDTHLDIAMQFAAFAALVGKSASNAWLDDSKRRVRMMPGVGGKKVLKTNESVVTKVEQMLPRYALIYGDEAVFDRELRRELSLGALRAYAGLKAVRDWGDHPNREVVLEEQVVFDPTRSLDDLSVCNLWMGWPYEADRGSDNDQEIVHRWLRVLHYACNESDAVFSWVIKWIAYPLQHPGTKMRSSIVMHGPEGSGKNTVWDAVRRMYARYGIQIGQTQLEQQWCDWISAKLFIVGNEVLHRQEQVQQKGRLKSLITEETIRVERKFMNGRTERNYANMVFLSNELRPLSLDPEDRRFLIVWTPPAHPDGYDFYKGLGEDSMQESAIRALYDYFLNVDIEDFSAHSKPPMTEAKRDLIDASLESHQRFVRDWLAGNTPLACRPCRTSWLFKGYLFWCRENGERFPKAENLFANRAKKEMPFGIKRYLAPETTDGVAKQATFYLPEGEPRPPEQSEAAWLGKEDSFFRKELEQWRNEQ